MILPFVNPPDNPLNRKYARSEVQFEKLFHFITYSRFVNTFGNDFHFDELTEKQGCTSSYGSPASDTIPFLSLFHVFRSLFEMLSQLQPVFHFPSAIQMTGNLSDHPAVHKSRDQCTELHSLKMEQPEKAE